MEFEAATAAQGRTAGGGRGSRKQAAPPPTSRVGGGRPSAAAGGRAGGKVPAAAAVPAQRRAVDPGLQSPTGKRRPGESGLQCSVWAVQYVGCLRHPLHHQYLCHLQPFSDTTVHTSCYRLFLHTPVLCFDTGAHILRGPAVTPKRQKTAAAVPKRAENEEHAVAMAEARAIANQEVRRASVAMMTRVLRLQMHLRVGS